ncbi:transcriptional regulator [Mycoplasma sp. NEAQ87857]|uniref:ArsR/SmtB family transcription factor n=1 Tax=Mycoplasma sp. NEAQ87857 TaxID=2683967 RepID=UPI001319721A|nr:transcriptional regulator [Mycoplasma sp. NEAQ87857]QGZ97515.1 transcriptional regulator [Mycoplasma sp. NEAQ87857]
MKTTQLLKVLSSDVKLKLIIHLYSCKLHECDVSTFVSLLNEKQANISKHLSDLKRLKIVNTIRQDKHIFYYIEPSFKDQYQPLLDALIKIQHLEKYECECAL